MKKFISFAGVGFVLAFVSLFGGATSSFASNYAYVNNSGDVNLFVANNAETALRDAPNMDVHSGVMLLDSTEDYDSMGLNQ